MNSSSTASGRAASRLQRELMDLMNGGPEGITAFPEDENIFLWTAVISGPSGSAYSGLEFRLSMRFPDQYPFEPPKVHFLTMCYHPNVLLKTPGDICLDILQNNWSAVLSATSVLVSIQSLLGEPNPASPLNAEAATLWEQNKEIYKEKVLEYHKRTLM